MRWGHFNGEIFSGETMEKTDLDFLQNHSEHYLRMALSTDKQESIQNPDGYGKNVGDCGDTVEMFLTVPKDCIRSVSCMVDGCINTNACANALAHLIEGKPVADCWKMTPEMVIDYLETLPPESAHCAELVVGALYRALSNYQDLKRNPWKKPYR